MFKSLCKFIPLIGLYFNSVFAVGFHVEWLIPSLVTNTNIQYYDVTATGSGMSVYQLSYFSTDADVGTQIRMTYQISGSSSETGGALKVLYQGSSYPYKLIDSDPRQISVNSKDFMKKEDPGPGVFYGHLRVGGNEQFDMAFRDRLINQILGSGQLVSGALRWTITMEQNANAKIKGASPSWVEVQTISRDVRIQQITRVEPIAPGSPAGSTVSDIPSQNPQFRWSSDMLTGLYNGEEMYEISIYHCKIGQIAQQCMQRPIHTARTATPSYLYPSSADPLEAGEHYLWVVKCLLRGVVESSLSSQPYTFRLASASKPADPETVKANTALKGLLFGTQFEGLLVALEGYDSEVSVNVDGKQMSTDELQSLLTTLRAGSEIRIDRASIH